MLYASLSKTPNHPRSERSVYSRPITASSPMPQDPTRRSLEISSPSPGPRLAWSSSLCTSLVRRPRPPNEYGDTTADRGLLVTLSSRLCCLLPAAAAAVLSVTRRRREGRSLIDRDDVDSTDDASSFSLSLSLSGLPTSSSFISLRESFAR